MAKIKICAHTGCENTHPNTLGSLLVGLRSGAEMVEVDVRGTKDGVAVLLHDEQVRVTDGHSLVVHDVLYEELVGQCDTPPVKLVDALDHVKSYHRQLMIDMKDPMYSEAIVQAVRHTESENHVILAGCHRDFALVFKRLHPDIQLLLNTEESLSLFNSSHFDIRQFFEAACLDAIRAGCCGLNMMYEYVTPEMVEYVQSRMLAVQVYTVDDPAAMHRMLKIGVDYITTNRVLDCMELRGSRAFN